MLEKPILKFIPFDKAPKCYQFVGSVIMFGAVLKKSKFVKDISWNEIMQIASSSADPSNYSQSEFLTLIQKAKVIYSRKRKKDREKERE
jgi:Ca-activated chloride channel family protein